MESDTPSELIEEANALTHRLVEGNLPQEGLDRLSVLICSHRKIARLYVTYMHLHRLLPRYVAAQDLILADDDLNATMILPALVEDDMTPISDGLLADEEREFQPTADPLPRPVKKPLKKWLWAAGIVLPLMIGSVVYEAIHTESKTQLVAETRSPRAHIAVSPAAVPPSNMTTGNPSPTPILLSRAVLADTLSATWADGFKPVTGAHLPLTLISLQSGLARLRFDNNVVVIVHGPAVFQVKSEMRLDLKSGIVSVEVPANAHNYAVTTPTATVTDLGTEFGVVADPAIGTHVEVFKGKVTAAAATAPPDAIPQTLTRDQAAEVAPGTAIVQASALEREKFVRPNEYQIIQQAGQSSYHRWLAYSYQLRHDPALALYYPFEASADADLIPNAALISFEKFSLDLSTQTPAVPRIGQGRWAEKSAVVFDGSRHQRLSLQRCPLTDNGTLTVTAWVNASSRPKWATIFKSRGDSVSGQFSLGLFGSDGDLVARVCQSDKTDVPFREGKQNPLPTGRWVFVALVADGQHAQLYRDGIEVSSGPCGPVITNPAIHSLSIGFQPANDGVSSRRQTEAYWDGAIDELALFHRPLSSLEIKQMYEAGKPD